MSDRSPPGHPTVLATVLTFNAPDMLVSCIDALLGQTRPPDAIVVVDNASRPAARAPAGTPTTDVSLLPMAENLGPAGGHAAGLARFLDTDHDLVWILDDDMIPDQTCLEVLVEAVDGARTSFALPSIHDLAAATDSRWPAWCGVLVPRAAVQAAGLPIEELFWWAEDTEYLQWRLPRAGWQAVWPADAWVTHHRIRETGSRPKWKIYYETRNSVYVRLHVKRQWRHPRKLLQTLGRLAWSIASREDHKVAKSAAFVRGVFDGLFGRLGRRVEVG